MSEKTYRIKEIFRTVQGEGFWSGRAAVFVRTVACNMWTGYEKDRERDAERNGAACPMWCFSPETPVLMADYTTKPIGQVRIGEQVMAATRSPDGKVKMEPTVVRNTLRRIAPLAEIEFDNQTVVGTPDHKVLCRRGNSKDRVRFIPANEAIGRGTYSLLGEHPVETGRNDEFWRGWLAGIAFGDGCFWTLKKADQRRAVPYDQSSPFVEKVAKYRRFRLAMHDDIIIETFRRKAEDHGFSGWKKGIHKGTGHKDYVMKCIHLTISETVEEFEEYLSPHSEVSRDYKRGFIAGFIDAEGHIRDRGVHIAQSEEANPHLCRMLSQYLDDLDISFTHSRKRDRWGIYGQDSFRLLTLCTPLLTRKTRRFDGRSLSRSKGKIVDVRLTGLDGPVITLTTDAGTYIAAGHVVKNCDTDFTVEGSSSYTASQLVEAVQEEAPNVRVVVFTGGEPALQVDSTLVRALHDAGYYVSMETNGTVPLAKAFDNYSPDWITCSPKLPDERLNVEYCNEVKLVVPDYRPKAYPKLIQYCRKIRWPDGDRRRPLYLQPEDGPRYEEAVALCLEIVTHYPEWTISTQCHKALGLA